jgi:hypothetical protein
MGREAIAGSGDSGGLSRATAHLFIEVLLSGQVRDGRVDTAPEILENHLGGGRLWKPA